MALFWEFQVPHLIRNVVHEPEARKDFYRLKLQLVPSFHIAGRIYEGYNPATIGSLLKVHYGIEIPEERLIVGIPEHKPWLFEYPKPFISIPKKIL